jgi:hypothetical protein
MMPFDRELLHRRFAKLTSNRLSLVTKRTEGEDTDDD